MSKAKRQRVVSGVAPVEWQPPVPSVVWRQVLLPYLSVHELARGYARTHHGAQEHVHAACRGISALVIRNGGRLPSAVHGAFMRLRTLELHRYQGEPNTRRDLCAILDASRETLTTLHVEPSWQWMSTVHDDVCASRPPTGLRVLRLLVDPGARMEDTIWRRWFSAASQGLVELACHWHYLELVDWHARPGVVGRSHPKTVLPSMPGLLRLSVKITQRLATFMSVLQRDAPPGLNDLYIKVTGDALLAQTSLGVDDDVWARAWFETHPNWQRLELVLGSDTFTWTRSEGRVYHHPDDDSDCVIHRWLAWLPAVTNLMVFLPFGFDAEWMDQAIQRMHVTQLVVDEWTVAGLTTESLGSLETLCIAPMADPYYQPNEWDWMHDLTALTSLSVDVHFSAIGHMTDFPRLPRLARLEVDEADSGEVTRKHGIAVNTWIDGWKRNHPELVVTRVGAQRPVETV